MDSRYKKQLIMFHKFRDAMCGAFCTRGRKCKDETGKCILLKLTYEDADLYRIKDFLKIPSERVIRKRIHKLRKPQDPQI